MDDYTPADCYACHSISKQDFKIISALDEASPRGLTRNEIAERTQISIRSVSARCNGLLHNGLLIPKIIPDTQGSVVEQRKTSTGRLAQVLVLNLANSAGVK